MRTTEKKKELESILQEKLRYEISLFFLLHIRLFFCEKVNLINFMSFSLCRRVFYYTYVRGGFIIYFSIIYILRKCAYNCNFTHSSSVREFNICTEAVKMKI